jgi:low affinity Fe/Cu permease
VPGSSTTPGCPSACVGAHCAHRPVPPRHARLRVWQRLIDHHLLLEVRHHHRFGRATRACIGAHLKGATLLRIKPFRSASNWNHADNILVQPAQGIIIRVKLRVPGDHGLVDCRRLSVKSAACAFLPEAAYEASSMGERQLQVFFNTDQRGLPRREVEMAEGVDHAVTRRFAEAAAFVARATGRPAAFGIAAGVIAAWAVSGPIFNYSDSWQLVINTGTTIVTFLMVFLIQNSQNRDSAAIQVKLDELIRASNAKNVFMGIEQLTEAEIEELRQRCEALAKAKSSRSRR